MKERKREREKEREIGTSDRRTFAALVAHRDTFVAAGDEIHFPHVTILRAALMH